MTPLTPPVVNDAAVLTTMASNTTLASYPELSQNLTVMLAQYVSYQNAGGNPLHAAAPVPLALSESLKLALENHYTKPPAVLGHLERMRACGSPDVCPMCGSFKTGTLDHIFPQSVFREFSIFSKNLVPACDCNSLRRNAYKGTGPGQRVLHPYFDTGIARRLVQARISSVAGDFIKPNIELEVCIPATDPLFPAVEYHLDNVVRKTTVLNYLSVSWLRLLRFCEDFHIRLPAGNFTAAHLHAAVTDALAILDRRRSTPNNWDSMLLAGLLGNAPAMQFLEQTTRKLRLKVLKPEDIQ